MTLNRWIPWHGWLPTLGGKQLWSDRVIRGGWRIQEHVWTRHHRLLDARDRRQAWGSLSACQAALAAARTRRALVDDDPHQPTVVLLHGILRSKDSLAGLARRLRAAGYQVVTVNYPSTRQSIAASASDVGQLFAAMPAYEDLVVVTASMGGLLMRELLSRKEPAVIRLRERIAGLVMLFPPNRGACTADRLHRRWWYRLLLGPAGQELTTQSVRGLALPTVPVRIIAGGCGTPKGRNRRIPGDDDGTVAVAETELPGAAAPEVLPVGHTYGANDPLVCSAVIQMIESMRHQQRVKTAAPPSHSDPISHLS